MSCYKQVVLHFIPLPSSVNRGVYHAFLHQNLHDHGDGPLRRMTMKSSTTRWCHPLRFPRSEGGSRHVVKPAGRGVRYVTTGVMKLRSHKNACLLDGLWRVEYPSESGRSPVVIRVQGGMWEMRLDGGCEGE